MKLAGKTALVTGGTSGIGQESARLMIEAGATVVIAGRDRKRLDDAVQALGVNAHAVQMDIGSPTDIAEAMRIVSGLVGRIDILIANAGANGAPEFIETTEAAFDALVGVNYKGTFFTVLHALPLLHDGASVILTGSVAARKGRPGDPLYSSSKGAVRSLGRALAMDEALLSRGVRVNVLTPGAIVTPLTREAADNTDIHDYVAAMIPMKRWGAAREVAEAVLFLASDASSYITGTEIIVDGGMANA